MRRSQAHHAHAYRHGAPKQEGPTSSILGGLLDAGRGELANNPSEIKPQQELTLLSGLLTPVQQSHTSVSNLIIRLFCADFHIKGVHHERTRAESISDSRQE